MSERLPGVHCDAEVCPRVTLTLFQTLLLGKKDCSMIPEHKAKELN